MTDKTGFSLDVTVNPASGFKPLPDRVAFDLCRAYPVAGDKVLLHNTITGKRAMVMPEVYTALLGCDEFQTFDQHVANIIEKNPGMQGQQADIHKVLKSMLENGMMVSAKKVCDRLKHKVETAAGDNQAALPVVAIITWERPQALERLLESIVANCDTDKIHRLYVIDDSRKAENISQNQLLVEKAAASIKAPIQYFGRQQQQSLLEDLVKRLPEHENGIRFLADHSKWPGHWTSGLARNLALLLSCGHRLVMMDDDTLCDVYKSEKARPDITFSDLPREAIFFASEQGWASWHQLINPDPVNRHMQCLGLPLSKALDVLGQNHLKPVGLASATALLTSQLHADSPILVTECGSLGCPGTGSNTWLPNMAPASLMQMLASERTTTNALTKRMVWSGRNQPHFAPRPNMSQITGFDNRQLLPPYLPIERGEDRLFGYLLDFIFPNAVTLDFPWAIPHLPIPQREWQEHDRDFAPGHSFPKFFLEKIMDQKSSCLATSPTERLASLSSWFIDLAAASNDSLAAIYRDSRLIAVSMQLQHLEKLLTSSDTAPTAWLDYLQNGIKQLNAAMDEASHEDFQLKGSPAKLEGEELIAFWKNVWTGFAAALVAWPEIRRVAIESVEAEANTSPHC